MGVMLRTKLTILKKYKQLIQDGIIPISFARSSGNLAKSFTKYVIRVLGRTISRGLELKPLK